MITLGAGLTSLSLISGAIAQTAVVPGASTEVSRPDVLSLSTGGDPAAGVVSDEAMSLMPVRTEAGQIRGVRRHLGDAQGDVRYIDYRGVPYALPPIGTARFREPQPPVPWQGIRQADTWRSRPLQSKTGIVREPYNTMIMDGSSEDCLYLDMVVPDSLSAINKGPYPVLFWISSDDNINTSEFARENASAFVRDGIILIDAGFRLGALGFMDVSGLIDGSYAGSGNNGLRDLIAALGWVRRNIGAFNGDPNRITVGGANAGAELVAALLAAPASQNLFAQALLHSGGETVMPARASADAAAEFLAASGYAPEQAAQVLQLPSEQILAIQQRVAARARVAAPFRPVMDGIVLAQRPLLSFGAGGSGNNAAGVRVLAGSNRDEFYGRLTGESGKRPLQDRELRHSAAAVQQGRFNEYEARYHDSILNRIVNRTRWGKVGERAEKSDDGDLMQVRRRFMTAEASWIPVTRMAEALVSGGGQVYLYRFDRLPGKDAELPYIWGTGKTPRAPQPEEDNLLRIHKPPQPSVLAGETDGANGVMAMHAYWVSFIYSGKPQAEGAQYWPPYEHATRPVMAFDLQNRILHDPDADERKIWNGWPLDVSLL